MGKLLLRLAPLLCFVSTSALATPEWYQKRSLNIQDIELIGYGSGKTQHDARTNASQDIAYQLGVDISIVSTKKSSLKNKQFNTHFSENIQQQTRHKLSNLDIVKSEKDGDWFVAVKTSAIPFWFTSRLYKAGPDRTIGYGSAKNLRQAQLNAAEEIALQLGGRIKVNTSQTTKLNNKKLDQNFAQDIKLISDHDVGNIRLLNNQRIKNTWYVVAEVGDDRHFSLKMIDKIRALNKACASAQQSHYLSSVVSIQAINTALGCTPAIQLTHRNNSWVLSTPQIEQIITDVEFKELIKPVTSAELSISSNKTTVYENDSYSLQLHSAHSGYLSCFIIYEDGHVALLFDNLAISPNQSIEFPDKDSGLELVAELSRRGVKTTDLYLAVLTKSPQQFTEFEEMTDTIQSSNDNINFGKLIDRINAPFSSTLIHTLPLSRKIH